MSKLSKHEVEVKQDIKDIVSVYNNFTNSSKSSNEYTHSIIEHSGSGFIISLKMSKQVKYLVLAVTVLNALLYLLL